jgi:hypothetical protein
MLTLSIATGTVKLHVTHVFQKVGIRRPCEHASYVLRVGISLKQRPLLTRGGRHEEWTRQAHRPFWRRCMASGDLRTSA